MLNKEEKDILFGYPLFHPIEVTDYLVDFVMNNIDNFPISSQIISRLDRPNHSLSELLNRNVIKNLLKSLYGDICDDSRFENCMNFTSAMIILNSKNGRKGPLTFDILEKNDEDIVLCLNLSSYNKTLLFSTNYDNDLIIIDNNDLSLLINFAQKKSISDIINSKQMPCNYYQLPISNSGINTDKKEKYFDRFEIFMRYITGVSSRSLTLELDSTNPYCSSNDILINCIMYFLNSSYENEESAFLNNHYIKTQLIDQTKVKHTEIIKNKSISEKPISKNYF